MSQNKIQYLNGVVENDATGFPMESVHVLNLNLRERPQIRKVNLKFVLKSMTRFIFHIWDTSQLRLLSPKT